MADVSLQGLAVGWVLGVASHLVVDYFKRDAEANRFRDAVKVDINEYGLTMASIYIQVQLSNDRASKEDIEVCKRVLKTYSIQNVEKHLEVVNALLDIPDDQFQVVSKKMVETRRGKAHNFRSINLSYLSSTPASIGILNSTEQKFLIQLLATIERANSQISDIQQWVKELVKDNYPKNAETNYNSGLDALMITLKQVFDLIDKINVELKSA